MSGRGTFQAQGTRETLPGGGKGGGGGTRGEKEKGERPGRRVGCAGGGGRELKRVVVREREIAVQIATHTPLRAALVNGCG